MSESMCAAGKFENLLKVLIPIPVTSSLSVHKGLPPGSTRETFNVNWKLEWSVPTENELEKKSN